MKKKADPARIRDLLDRLGRAIASEDWGESLNPAQRGALAHLAQANRFSRSPSHVADYLCTTRGTASQTLKALEKKGLIARAGSEKDRRSIAYEITPAGRKALGQPSDFDMALGQVDSADGTALEDALAALLTEQLKARGFRSFGLCKTCKHHQRMGKSAYCRLLDLPLKAEESEQICHEHELT